MSFASQLAVFGYLVVVTLALAAILAAWGRARPARESLAWGGAAGYFLLLIVMRLLDGEERMRAVLREMANAHEFYGERGAWQLAIALTCVLLLCACALRLWFYFRRASSRRARTSFAVLLLLLFSVLLYAVRIVSWHVTDALLYAGPMRLNWLLECAIMLGMAGLAMRYLRLSRASRKAVE